MAIDLEAIESRAKAGAGLSGEVPSGEALMTVTTISVTESVRASLTQDIPALLAEVRRLQRELALTREAKVYLAGREVELGDERDSLRAELDRIKEEANKGGLVPEIDPDCDPVETKMIKARFRAACIVRAEQAERGAEDLRVQLAEASRNADLRGAQLLMVGSELCGDPKIDPADLGDPRNTPTLREAAKMRSELDRARALPGKWRRLLEDSDALDGMGDDGAVLALADDLDAALRGKDGGE